MDSFIFLLFLFPPDCGTVPYSHTVVALIHSRSTDAVGPQPSLRSQRGNAASALRNMKLRFCPPQCSLWPELQRLRETGVKETTRPGTLWPSRTFQDLPGPQKTLTLPVPLHADSVSLEEALVGESSRGSAQHRVLIQTHEWRSSFTARNINRHLEGKKDRLGPGPGPGLSLALHLSLLTGPHLTGLNSWWQLKVWNLLHVELVGNRVWKATG